MRLLFSIAFLLAVLIPAEGNNAVFASVLTDNMVLQQNTNVTLWGFAPPNEMVKVSCSWLKETLQAATGKNGQWSVIVRTPKADFTAHSITLTDSQGNTTTLQNVLSGEVWLCSGQSNMEMILMSQPEWNMIVENSEEHIKQAYNKYLRVITIGRKESFTPVENAITNGWKETTPDNARWFSSVAYFFGRRLFEELHVPIGLIVSSYGGSPIQSWIPDSVLKTSRIYADVLIKKQAEITASGQSEEEYKNAMSGWISHSEQSKITAQDGIMLTLPVNLEKSSVGNQMGEVSFRKTIEITPDNALKDLQINLGTMDDLGRVYFNGELFWEEIRNSKSYSKISFTVPAEKVKPGVNVIEARVLNILWGGGLTGPVKEMYYTMGDDDNRVSLAGPWEYNKIFDLSVSQTLPLEGKPLFSTASSLYNGMIFPLKRFSIKGVIWYQGAGNVGEADRYTQMMVDMVGSWRSCFKDFFPFYFVQISPYQYNGYYGTDAASLREAQSKAEEIIPESGMIVTMDLGDPKNIHPARKLQVGERLANKALSKTYNVKKCSEYPKVKKVKSYGEKVVVIFSNTCDGLTAKGEKHEIEVSDDGINYKQAVVKISGNRIEASSPDVKSPRFIRYCWRDGAEGTIFNSEGLPVTSFRVEANK
ncbi:MAG TPA: sialate O-acetylesterase [Bacteroidales bacterium]|nr:sialate O-acetylesterase [Bacteroidales bacterium]HPT11042.1 sialate O-acetylesterase [Bacteroidales bacterium]